jgi:hypothetical protein
MPLSNYSAYLTALAEKKVDIPFSSTFTCATTSLFSRYYPGAIIPTTSIALDRTSTHSITTPLVGSGRLTILGAQIGSGPSGPNNVCFLVDILNISGGLSGTVTTTQTTNLPTASLTRFTNGEGVMAGLVLWEAGGNTATTATVSYTNTTPTSGRTSPAFTIGGIPNNNGSASRLHLIPLQAGDTGVRSVESVTLAGSTGVAGNMGICLFKPLALMAGNSGEAFDYLDAVSTGRVAGALAEVHPDACLNIIGAVGPGNGQQVYGSVILAEV